MTSNEDWQQLAVNEGVIFADGVITYQNIPEQPVCLSMAEGLSLAKNA